MNIINFFLFHDQHSHTPFCTTDLIIIFMLHFVRELLVYVVLINQNCQPIHYFIGKQVLEFQMDIVSLLSSHLWRD